MSPHDQTGIKGMATTAAAVISSMPSVTSAARLSLTNSSVSKFPLFPSSSAHDLVLLPLRIVYRAEVFLFVTVPRNFVRLLGLETMMTTLIDGASGRVAGGGGGEIERDGANVLLAAANSAATRPAALVPEGSGLGFGDLLQTVKRFSGFFSYVTSRWSLACFAVALILNRVTIYASTRRHITLKWGRRLALRIIPIVLLIGEVLTLLRAIRCQTSPDYSVLRYGKLGKNSSLDYAGDGGALYGLSSFLLPWENDETSCKAVHMGRPNGGSDLPYGSFSLLWPVFLRLCLSHFIETLSCALQGRAVVTEAGMSIFEHSLAFAEAETMISQSVGLGLFGLPKQSGSTEGSVTSSSPSAAQVPTRGQMLERLNVTPELLLIALISCCNSLTSNLLDVFGRQSQYRLFSTTFWGLCFMGSIIWGFFGSSSLGSDAGFLNFPTVCIVGFVPHLLILLGILICVVIYGLALLITAYALPSDLPHPTSIRQRFSLAHGNMQGSSQIRNVRLNVHEDFYTALVRIGYAALTAASEAVFLNEGKSVVARRMTWLEEDRLTEIETSRNRDSHRSRRLSTQPISVSFEVDETFNFDIPERPVEWESGYAREKKIEKLQNGSRSIQTQSGLGGVGAFQGATRCYHGFSFFRGIFFLLLRWYALGIIKLLHRLGIKARPQWLTKLGGVRQKGDAAKRMEEPGSLDFWILTDQGLELPEDNEFDVEKEMRKRELTINDTWGEAEEMQFERKLYNWWKIGGSWGNQDESGDYYPPPDEWEDTTSVVSTSTNGDSEWEGFESGGCRTPTQSDPYAMENAQWLRNQDPRSGSPVPEILLDTASLARLLDPKDSESKHEARVLASHLVADQEGGVMTRSRFRRQMERERARVLTSSRYGHAHFQGSASSPATVSDERKRPTPDEESEILENLILSRRLGFSSSNSQPDSYHPSSSRHQQPQSWNSGASGLGPDGPQCVICQAAPRSIITWPCRCLCVCEDCRVSLAMNNFGSCVTCRREVTGFVRLWVP